jgi:hypothetical protein
MCQTRRPRTSSLKRLSGNVLLLTLDLWLDAGWLCSCVAVWLYDAFAKRSRTPENRLGLGAGLGLKPSLCGSCQRTPSIETAVSSRYIYRAQPRCSAMHSQCERLHAIGIHHRATSPQTCRRSLVQLTTSSCSRAYRKQHIYLIVAAYRLN